MPVQSSNLGDGLVSDDRVTLNYCSGRTASGEALVLGRRARLRSGTVLYEGTRIGNDFETGHPAGMVAYGCPTVPVRAVAELEPIAQRLKRVDAASCCLQKQGKSL